MFPRRPAHPPQLPLATALAGHVRGALDDRPVTGITLDSRAVQPGWLYVALPGTRAHGMAFATQAVARGAVAVLTDEAGGALASGLSVPVLIADDLREAMAVAAARIFCHPARALTTFGLTGTNGKTTTAFLTAAALADRRVATVGTIGFRLDGEEIETARTTVTTPESPDLQALLAVLVERGAQAAAIEVSSHALALRRVDGMTFDVAAFINLGRDHLDFHGTLDDYFEAKARLFTPELSRKAVINIGDEAGARLAATVRARGQELVTVGVPSADYHLSDIRRIDPLHTISRLHTPSGVHELHLTLPGDYNALNAMIAFALAETVGCAPDIALAGLVSARVPGRMQVVELDDRAPLVVVDFAHTPQAVEAALATFAPYRGERRVIALLGAGGDRDRDKRALMGRAAAAGADVVVVTDDNPRTEDPAAIRAALLAGVGEGAIELPGRAEAIRAALDLAEPGDIVVILGKGHESGQIIGDSVIQFNDVDVARAEWASLTKGTPWTS